MLKKKNVTNPTDAQLNKAMDKIEEELHAITFMCKADRQKYGNGKQPYYKRKILFPRL